MDQRLDKGLFLQVYLSRCPTVFKCMLSNVAGMSQEAIYYLDPIVTVNSLPDGSVRIISIPRVDVVRTLNAIEPDIFASSFQTGIVGRLEGVRFVEGKE